MVSVNAVSGVTNTTTTASTAANDAAAASLDYDSFLQLLIAQMANQDPTDPMDASEQIAQLATFSQVEQSIKMNSNLETLISQSNLSTATNYLGKIIQSADGETTGTIAYVTVTSDGLVATTAEGDDIKIQDGVLVGLSADI